MCKCTLTKLYVLSETQIINTEWQCLTLLLLIAGVALSEKKVDLEDIERDQFPRTEGRGSTTKKASLETLRAEETQYPTTAAETPSGRTPEPTLATTAHRHQQYHHAPTISTRELGNQAGDYAELPAYESFKYAAPVPEYGQGEDASDYAQAGLLANPVDQQQQQQQQQYYSQQSRSHSQNDYEQQQQLYQQEVLGNQLQQAQKTLAPNYADMSDDKGAYYINIPTSQLLAYYQQNYAVVEPKSKSPDHQPQPQPLPIPVYTPMLTQSQDYPPMKVTYQPEAQYVPAYPQRTQPMYNTKPASAAPTMATMPAATASVAQHQAAPTSQYPSPVEVLPYQYYLAQPAQPLAYENAFVDFYSGPAGGFVQDDNSLYEPAQQQQPHHQRMPQQQQPQYYVPAALAEQIMAQILQHAGIHSAAAQVVKHAMPEPTSQRFTPPQYQAQKFRGSAETGESVPVSVENEGYSSATLGAPSRPKTLLDSYVPSHVIAAQDANRYRERPIKLESGFLPSKINFIQRRSHKKRKSD
ncbi:transcription factor SPT20 homolog [Copidosoma floridanum]|uniref:transcription factor SPT20 homolog n=1 Tax=Copidosoma floridanum TaxID=29053 RepID=UPI0006C95348|nr:transcription factor SPT20 homolog [Copidosoma floridanum]